MHKYIAHKYNLLSLFLLYNSLNVLSFFYKDSYYINAFHSLSTYIYVLSEADLEVKPKEKQRSHDYENIQSVVSKYSISLLH